MGTKHRVYTKEEFDFAFAESKNGRSATEIARSLGTSRPVVAAWLSGENLPRSIAMTIPGRMGGPVVPIAADHRAMTVEKAYLLGVLVGDGSLSNSTYCYMLEAADIEMVQATGEAIHAVYGLPFSVKPVTIRNGNAPTFRIQVGSKLMHADLLETMDGHAPSSLCWRIPASIRTGDVSVRGAFLRGYADSEGHVENSRKRRADTGGTICSRQCVSLYSINKVGVEQVCDVLASIGIASRTRVRPVNSNRPHALYELNVNREENLTKFQRLIGFTIPRKARALEEIVSAYQDRGSTSLQE